MFRKGLAFINRIYSKISESRGDNARMLLRIRSEQRKILSGQYSFVSMEDAVLWTCDWIRKLPESFDIIVGIPRSGLIIASIIAVKLGKPLATPEMVYEKNVWMSSHCMPGPSFNSFLLIEDSTVQGLTLDKVRNDLRLRFPDAKITCGSLIVTDASFRKVDLFYKRTNGPIAFEWGIMHLRPAPKVAMDLDGVLCENCPEGVDSDDSKYDQWVNEARPFLIPGYEIDFVVTNRLEKYRPQTETWLKKHGVKYRALLMWDLPDKKLRTGKHAEHKVEMVTKARPDILLESSENEALEVWRRTGIPTICIDSMTIFS